MKPHPASRGAQGTIQTIISLLTALSLIFSASACGSRPSAKDEVANLTLSSTADFPATKKVAVFYEDDPAQEWNYGKVYAITTRNLLGHFSTQVDLINVAEYHSGDLQDYDAGIYLGNIYDYPLKDTFKLDVLNSTNPFLWINYNIWQLYKIPDWNAAGKLGFEYLEVQTIKPFTNILYKGQRLPRLDSDIEFNMVKFEAGSGCSELAHIEVQQNGQSTNEPFTIRCGNFFYMANNPLANFFASYLVLADILHDLLGTDARSSLRALVRLEDLTPGNVNYEILRREVDALHKMGIPFAFGVIPVNYDPLGVTGKAGLRVPLHKDFLLQELIEYMIMKGGTPVMHGFTHQHSANSAIDYEFWDGENNQPFAEDGYDWALDRIDQGREEFEKAMGFIPQIWETPHYAATPNTYFALASRFGVVYERLSIFDSLEIPLPGKSANYTGVRNFTYTTPYQLFTSFYGFRVLPENLGYLERDGIPELGFPPTPQGKADLARMYTVVRDGVVSFMFHHWQPEEDLYETIRLLQEVGYVFVSAGDLLQELPPAYE